MEFEATERRYTRILLTWALITLGVGAGLAWAAWVHERFAVIRLNAFMSALAMQFLIWGGIDLAFVLVGTWTAARRRRHPLYPTAERLRRARLIRFVEINVSLDAFYILVGCCLLVGCLLAPDGDPRATIAGHGAGVVFQALFLLVFDWFLVKRLDEHRSAP